MGRGTTRTSENAATLLSNTPPAEHAYIPSPNRDLMKHRSRPFAVFYGQNISNEIWDV